MSMSFKNWLNENFIRSTPASQLITLVQELQAAIQSEHRSQELQYMANSNINNLKRAAGGLGKNEFRDILNGVEHFARTAKDAYESYGLSEIVKKLSENLRDKVRQTQTIVTSPGKESREDLGVGKGGLSGRDRRDFHSQEYERQTRVHPEKENLGFTHKGLTKGINNFVPKEPTQRYKNNGDLNARDQKDLIVLFKDLERAISKTPHGPKLMAAIEQDYTDMATWSVALDAMEEETGRDTSKFRARLQRAINNLK